MSGITIEGLDDLLKRLNGAPASVTKAVDIELNDGAQSIAAIAKSDAPANTGNLRQGIGADKEGDLNYNVFSNAEYSAYVEFGTGSKVTVPAGLEEYAATFQGGISSGGLTAKQAIFAWCEQKGIDKNAWYAIYVSIMNNGSEPHPFFFGAKIQVEGQIITRVTEALNEAI